jgi:hypothetical protein
MRALIVRIAVAVGALGCTTSPAVDTLLALSDGDGMSATGGGAGAGGEPGTGGSAGDGAGGDQEEPTSVDARPPGDGAAREGGAPDASASSVVVDGAVDARGPRVDASDSGALRTIRCGGNALCDVATEYCCAEENNFRCLKRTQTAACARYAERLYCDERTDCPSGQVCCLATNMLEMRDDATCSADCSAGFRLCDPARPSGCEAPSICADNVPVASYLACRD